MTTEREKIGYWQANALKVGKDISVGPFEVTPKNMTENATLGWGAEARSRDDIEAVKREAAALLRGLDKLLQEETALPVHVAEDPLSAVGEGAGRVLNELEFLRKVSTTEV